MRTTFTVRGRVPVSTPADCACAWDEATGTGWTCEACLDAADTGAERVELAEV